MENSNLKRFFIKNKSKLSDYFNDNVKVSKNDTLIKFGSIDNENVSINFFIKGNLDDKITSYEDKIKYLINSENDVSLLNRLVKEISEPKEVVCSPYIKVTHDPEQLVHAFQLTFFYNRGL